MGFIEVYMNAVFFIRDLGSTKLFALISKISFQNLNPPVVQIVSCQSLLQFGAQIYNRSSQQLLLCHQTNIVLFAVKC